MIKIDKNLIEYCETDRQREVLNAVIDSDSIVKAAKSLNVDYTTVQRMYQRVEGYARQRNYAPDFNIDRPLPRNQQNAGISELVDERTGQSILKWYKSKNRPEKNTDSIIECLEALTYVPAPKIPKPKVKADKDLISLYTLTDFHLGMYAWADETGEDWDTEIASRVLLNAIGDMCSKAPDSETAILNLQGDFLHWDGLDAVTPMNKHVLDADTRFDRMIELSLDLTMWSIEMLARKHKKVKVIICEGNHDLAGSGWLRKSMKKIYTNNNRVEIDDTSFPYYAHLHGEIMLGFHHGHKKKNTALPALFSSEPRYRSMWGAAKYCYIHTGHYHQTEQDMSEGGGAIVERHPTLAARDAYAARGGYVSRRGARVITYHITEGEVDRSTVLPR